MRSRYPTSVSLAPGGPAYDSSRQQPGRRRPSVNSPSPLWTIRHRKLMPNDRGIPPATTRHGQVGSIKAPGQNDDDDQRQRSRRPAATRRVSGSSPLGGALPAGQRLAGSAEQD